MHKFAKQIMECVKTKVEAMGIDNIEGQHLEELDSGLKSQRTLSATTRITTLLKL